MKGSKPAQLVDRVHLAEDAYHEFLHWIERVAPEVVTDLTALGPLTRFSFGQRDTWNRQTIYEYAISKEAHSAEFILAKLDPTYHPWYANCPPMTDEQVALVHAFEKFKEEFNAVIDRYNLRSSPAICTRLFEFVNDLEYVNEPRLTDGMGFGLVPFQGPDLCFDVCGWSIGGQTPEEYIESQVMDLRARLRDHVMMTIALARKAGHKDARGSSVDGAKLKYLVLHTVKGWSDERIVAELGQTTHQSGASMDAWAKQKRRWALLGLPVRGHRNSTK